MIESKHAATTGRACTASYDFAAHKHTEAKEVKGDHACLSLVYTERVRACTRILVQIQIIINIRECGMYVTICEGAVLPEYTHKVQIDNDHQVI
jgi:hypothetical protein